MDKLRNDEPGCGIDPSPVIFDVVHDFFETQNIGVSTLTDIDNRWPTVVSLFRSSSGNGQRFLKGVFEIFIPTRTIQLHEISGGMERTSFSYQKGMVAFSPPQAHWEIEWQGTIEGVCFYFAPETMRRAAADIYGEELEETNWRLALSDYAPAIAYLGLDIASQAKNGFPVGQDHINDLMRAFLSLAIRRYSKSDRRNSARVGIFSPQVLQAIKYIDANLEQDLSTDSICFHSAVSVPHLNRLFRKEVGHSVWRYVTRQRLNLAARKLLETTETVDRIGRSSGFRSKVNFERHFKARFGVTPIAYRTGTRA